jgi:hypothetical protein
MQFGGYRSLSSASDRRNTNSSLIGRQQDRKHVGASLALALTTPAPAPAAQSYLGTAGPITNRSQFRYLQTALNAAKTKSSSDIMTPLPSKGLGPSRTEESNKANSASNQNVATATVAPKPAFPFQSETNQESFVFMDFSTEQMTYARVKFRLFDDRVPLTCDNFRKLCTGELGFGYVGSRIHRIVKNFVVQGETLVLHDRGLVAGSNDICCRR